MTHWCLYAPVGTLNYHYIAEIYKYWPHASIRRSDSIQFNSSQIGPTLPCDTCPAARFFAPVPQPHEPQFSGCEGCAAGFAGDNCNGGAKLARDSTSLLGQGDLYTRC